MRVLLVEDDISCAESLMTALLEIDADYAIEHVTSVASALSELDSGKAYDFALVDLGLPDADSFEAPAKLSRQYPELGVVALTKETDQGLASAVIRLGAQDFLSKGDCGPLAVDRALRSAMERRERELALKDVVNIDSLTGVLNRRGALTFLEGRASSHRIGRDLGLALLYLDLDGFDAINELHGDSVGDAVLWHCAQRINHCLRSDDKVARVTGDEFAIMFDVEKQPEDSAFVAKKLIEKLAEPFSIGDLRMTVSANVGIACMPEHAEGISGLIDCAKAAMHEAKKTGNGGYVYYQGPRIEKADADLQGNGGN